MKNICRLLSVALFSVVSHAASACLLTTHVGSCGNSGPHPITTPSTIPLSSSYFTQSNSVGFANNALLPNNNTTGALNYPTNTADSFFLSFDAQVGTNLVNGETIFENVSGANGSISLNAGGTPTFLVTRSNGFWQEPSLLVGSTGAGAGTSTGFATYPTSWWPVTATTGGCARPPVAVFRGGTSGAVGSDPGFNCPGAAPTKTNTGLTASGYAQTVTTTPSCAVVGTVAQTTFSLPSDPGFTMGQTFKVSGFTPSAFASTTFTVISDGTTLVASGLGTACTNAATSTGTVFTGVAGDFTWSAASLTNPYVGQTGVQTKPGQHICAAIVQYGENSSYPGAQAFIGVDHDGNSLPGSPAFSTNLNQGTAVATGWLVSGSQGTSAPALHITSMVNPATIASWTYSGTTGYVTFTTSAGTGFTPGSEFTVSGSTGGNVTYVAVNPSALTAVAYQSSTVIVGNPLSGPLGTLQANNPGASGTGGAISSVLMPNMVVLGSTSGTNLSPFTASGNGPFGMTGTGSNGSSGTPATYGIVGTPATSLGSSGSPITLFFYSSPYFTATASGSAWGGLVAPKTSASLAGMYTIVGSNSSSATSHLGWSGSVGNVAMVIGAFKQASDGSPDVPTLASICKSQTDLQTYAAAQTVAGNTTNVQSLAVLDDPGMWGDSGGVSGWYGSGWISGASGSGATFNTNSSLLRYGVDPTSVSPAANSVLSGPGIPGCPLACPKFTGTGLAITWTTAIAANVGSSGSPTSMKIGAWNPMAPLGLNNVLGYIDNGSGSTPTLHVTSTAAASTAKFTGTLGSQFNGYISNGTSGTAGHTLTVTTPAAAANDEGYAPVGVGTIVNIPGTLTPMTVTAAFGTTNPDTGQMLTGGGYAGTYALSTGVSAQAAGTSGAPVAFFGTGVLPANATSLMINSVASGVIAGSSFVTDGGVNITGDPIYTINAGATVGTASPCPCVTWTINPTYTPLFTSDANLSSSPALLFAGQYIRTTTAPGVGVSTITTPVEIIGLAPGFSASSYPQSYLLSNGASNGVGSSGTPVAISGTGIGDGGAVAPGPALTIKDIGPGVTFPVSSMSCPSGIASCAGTGSIPVSGTFDTSVLGGKPSSVQAQVSYAPNGPAISGCSACAYINLTGYSATLSSGTVWNWSGTLVNIPPSAAPLFVSVRAANDSRISAGTFYATMPSYFKVGIVYPLEGEGEVGAWASVQTGWASSPLSVLWGKNLTAGTSNASSPGFYTGPPVVGSLTPAQTIPLAGDPFGIGSGGSGLPEGPSVFNSTIASVTAGWPVTGNWILRDASGSFFQTYDYSPQSQTVGVGDNTRTVWCSRAPYCLAAQVSAAGPFYDIFPSLTGASIANGVIANGTPATLTVPIGLTSANGVYVGSLGPGLTLWTGAAQLATAPTLSYCISGCGFANYGLQQVWAITCTGGCASVAASYPALRAEPLSGPAPLSAVVSGTPGVMNGSNFGNYEIGLGTFKLTDNGVLICSDAGTVFSWTAQGTTCTTAAGSPFTVTASAINITTGDYSFTLSPAPSTSDNFIASWTGISSPGGSSVTLTDRPPNLGLFGNTDPTSGWFVNNAAKTPGGVSFFIDGGYINDDGGLTNTTYPQLAAGLTQQRSYYYGTKWPTNVPGFGALSPPVMSVQTWRSSGAIQYQVPAGVTAQIFGQWGIDFTIKSTMTGTISSGVLTLGAVTSGEEPWNGEVINCATVTTACPLTANSGVFIQDLCTVATCGVASPAAWGLAGSTYALSGASGLSVTSGTMQNALAYTGPGGAFYGGPINDLPTQGSVGTADGQGPHGSLGPSGGRRVGAHWAAQSMAAVAKDPTVASNGRLSRAVGGPCSTSASPCFDYTNTYAASHAATWSGNTITITGGIAAHARPFVVGQALTFSAGGGTGFYITSVSLPPSQDTSTGNGQVGQTFTMKVSNAVGGGASSTLTGSSGTVTAGCSTGSGGNQCIDFVFEAGTTKGTYTTPWALATCGENNEDAFAAPGGPSWGKCVDNGKGTLVRNIMIGTNQAAWSTGMSYDDGVSVGAGAPIVQSNAFTCNIVDTTVLQCVKGNVYDPTTHLLTGIGGWPSASTYVECCDSNIYASRGSSIMGNVGGQPFAATPGSGQSNGTTPVPSITGLQSTFAGSVATTCVAGSGIHTVTASVSQTHLTNGPGAGALFVLSGFGTGFTGYNTSYTSTGASTQTLLVGTATGSTCPTTPVTPTFEGSASYGCGTLSDGFASVPIMDITIAGGVIVNAYPGSSLAIGNGGVNNACLWTATAGGTAGTVTIAANPPEGVGGIATATTDQNRMGINLRGNEMITGNPLHTFGVDGAGILRETGLGIRPFGGFLGVGVSN